MNWKCPKCDEQFSTKKEAHIHLNLMHLKKPEFSCSNCKKQFKTEPNLAKHLTKKFKGKTCHERQYLDCPDCSRRFPEKESLSEHIDKRHRQMYFYCLHCSKQFLSKGRLNAHMKSHDMKNWLQCPMCFKRFWIKASFKKHILIHHQYKCTLCEKGFLFERELEDHMSTHCSQKTFKCKKCTQSFACKESLKRHVDSIHLKHPYACKKRCDDFKNNKYMHNGRVRSSPFNLVLVKECFDDRLILENNTSESGGTNTKQLVTRNRDTVEMFNPLIINHERNFEEKNEEIICLTEETISGLEVEKHVTDPIQCEPPSSNVTPVCSKMLEDCYTRERTEEALELKQIQVIETTDQFRRRFEEIDESLNTPILGENFGEFSLDKKQKQCSEFVDKTKFPPRLSARILELKQIQGTETTDQFRRRFKEIHESLNTPILGENFGEFSLDKKQKQCSEFVDKIKFPPRLSARILLNDFETIAQVIDEFLKPNQETSLLEMGSGNSILSLLLSNKCKEVIGLDNNSKLKHARKICVHNRVKNACLVEDKPENLEKLLTRLKNCENLAVVINHIDECYMSTDKLLSLGKAVPLHRFVLITPLADESWKFLLSLLKRDRGNRKTSSFIPLRYSIVYSRQYPATYSQNYLCILFIDRAVMSPDVEVKHEEVEYKIDIKLEF